MNYLAGCLNAETKQSYCSLQLIIAGVIKN